MIANQEPYEELQSLLVSMPIHCYEYEWMLELEFYDDMETYIQMDVAEQIVVILSNSSALLLQTNLVLMILPPLQ